jgi:serine/threonine protein kinase/tetratricopeptide (TPR) repeat protein
MSLKVDFIFVFVELGEAQPKALAIIRGPRTLAGEAMAEEEDRGKSPRPRLQALRDFLLGAPGDTTPFRATPPAAGAAAEASASMPERIGRYRVLRKLGQGGMGVVYAAQDERLERTLAIKTILGLASDETARKRFWREARAAASVNHPNVCQLYEVGEEEGTLFIAMELLDGEPLAARLGAGAFLVDEAVPVVLGVLGALGALHRRGIVHRDLKPSNVFLTSHGVKLLDFGLARPADALAVPSASSLTDLTRPGELVGTPRYMAPEQVTGDEVGFHTDLFAAGAILFEMLAGQPAFSGKTVVEVLYATLHEQPPALSGSPAVAAVDRVIRRALAKAPKDRYPTAEAMAEDLRSTLLTEGTGETARASTLTRLVVLPFRSLRPDADTDFLAFSLPDAISTSLSGLPSLVVRSSATAARFASGPVDLKTIAAEADVDRVLTGTLLRSGEHLRVATQLAEAPGGTLVFSHSAQGAVGDIFALQDDLTRRIVEALALPLAGVAAAVRRDVPQSARAYEFYLRANEVGRGYENLTVARDLYRRCLEEDPEFAPAWARLGRCHRVIGKFFEERPDNRQRAEAAFKRALELNPDLPIGHKLYAHLEAEVGRAPEAMTRLVRLAATNRNDPELFAGLVHACRYCGLFDASLAAHREARRLDPTAKTSVPYTLLLAGEYETLLSEGVEIIDSELSSISLWRLGREAEALAVARKAEAAGLPRLFAMVVRAIRLCLEGTPVEAMRLTDQCLQEHDDPEAVFVLAQLVVLIGEHSRALEELARAVRGGFFAAPTLARDPWLDPFRATPAFRAILAEAEAGRRKALAAFRDAGGEGLLGVRPA